MSRGELASMMLDVLGTFDSDALERFKTSFGGGARIALDHDHFRVSTDLDFVCSDASAFADLRIAVRARGLGVLIASTPAISLPREPRVDAYGVRFPVVVGARTLRVEIIREGRIELGPPEHPSWSPAPCLSIRDCFTEKLLANSDRWADRDVLSRDLIDLSVLRVSHGPVPEAAWAAAASAYKEAARTDLRRAVAAFLADERHRERCFTGLQIDDRSRVMRGAELLAADLEG